MGPPARGPQAVLPWMVVFAAISLQATVTIWTLLHTPPPLSYVPLALALAGLTIVTVACIRTSRGR